MEEQLRSERMNDDQVRARVMETWDELNGWTTRLAQPWMPAPNSILAEDDAASTSGFRPTHLTWTSIATGTEHLMTASAYLLNFGPTMFSMQTLLRTAMLGSAQVVWMLAPDDRATRLERTAKVSHDASLNQLLWVNGIKDPHPDTFNPAEFPEAQRKLTGLVGGNTALQVKATKVIEAAAEYAYRGERTATTECLATWRVLSCVAHALPWELNVRTAETDQYQLDGRYVATTRASWANLQAALSVSYAFAYTGWKLLDDRGAART